MIAWEDKLKAYIQKYIFWLAFIAVFLFGAFMRYTLVPYVVPDMMADYIPWMQALQLGGIHQLLTEFSPFPYSAMYVYIWALVAKVFPHTDAIVLLKGTAYAFEAAMVVVSGYALWTILPKARRVTGLFVGFVLLWLSPVLLMNTAVWGQTDVVYLCFAVLALFLVLQQRPALAMVSFGLAMAFKLQAVFLLPALIILYFCFEKKFSILWFLLIPAVWFAASLPLQLMNSDASSPAALLAAQTNSYVDATMNYPNLHALMNEAVKSPLLLMVKWERYAIILTITFLGSMAAWLISRNVQLNRQNALLLSAWCVFICVFFLPHMHERYGIVGEVLLLLWAVVLWKPRGFLYLIVSILPIASAYCKYTLDREMFSLQLGGAIQLFLMIALTWELIRQGKESLHGA